MAKKKRRFTPIVFLGKTRIEFKKSFPTFGKAIKVSEQKADEIRKLSTKERRKRFKGITIIGTGVKTKSIKLKLKGGKS